MKYISPALPENNLIIGFCCKMCKEDNVMTVNDPCIIDRKKYYQEICKFIERYGIYCKGCYKRYTWELGGKLDSISLLYMINSLRNIGLMRKEGSQTITEW